MKEIIAFQLSNGEIVINEGEAIRKQLDILGEALDGFLPYDDRGNVTQVDRFNILTKQMGDSSLRDKIDELHHILHHSGCEEE